MKMLSRLRHGAGGMAVAEVFLQLQLFQGSPAGAILKVSYKGLTRFYASEGRAVAYTKSYEVPSNIHGWARSESVSSLWVERLGEGALYCICCGAARSVAAEAELKRGPSPGSFKHTARCPKTRPLCLESTERSYRVLG